MWPLLKAMYGTRIASGMFQEFMQKVFLEAGYKKSMLSHQVLYNVEADSLGTLHGDDILAEGENETLDRLDTVLEAKVQVKKLGRVGLGQGNHGRYFKRHIVFVDGQRLRVVGGPKARRSAGCQQIEGRFEGLRFASEQGHGSKQPRQSGRARRG